MNSHSNNLIRKSFAARVALKSLFLVILCGGMLLGAFRTSAQNLDEFRNCASEKGVASIPYNNLRERGRTVEAEKVLAFNETLNYGIGTLKPKKEKILKDLAAARLALSNNQKHLEIDKRDYPSITSPYESKVDKSEDDVELYDNQLKAVNAEIAIGIERYNKLIMARESVRKLFEEVDKELDYSLNRPETHIGSVSSSDSDEARNQYASNLAQLKSYIYTIGSKIDDEAIGHAKQEEEVKNALQNLQNLLAQTN